MASKVTRGIPSTLLAIRPHRLAHIVLAVAQFHLLSIAVGVKQRRISHSSSHSRDRRRGCLKLIDIAPCHEWPLQTFIHVTDPNKDSRSTVDLSIDHHE